MVICGASHDDSTGTSSAHLFNAYGGLCGVKTCGVYPGCVKGYRKLIQLRMTEKRHAGEERKHSNFRSVNNQLFPKLSRSRHNTAAAVSRS
jgi:hypothetical protein